MAKMTLLWSCIVTVLIGSGSLSLRGQTDSRSTAKLVFDAVSVKPNVSGQRGYSLPPPTGERFTATNVSLNLLVTYAYHLNDVQLAGATGWMSSEAFDIEAKAPFPASENQVRLMLQPVLAERFNLKFHTENRQMSAYTLQVSKKGLRMKRSTKSCDPGASSTVPCGGFRLYQRRQLTGLNVPMGEFVDALGQLTGRVVVDKTGLSGTFDITLQWTPDEGLALGPEAGAAPAANSQDGALFTALDEQLGLRLQSEKQTLPVLTIDSAQRPSRN
jgi:uncharacterized protein (TIGR03435 family)